MDRIFKSIEKPKLARFKEAYLSMARNADYRPDAGHGWGLDTEAAVYAAEFCTEENTDAFNIGCSDFTTNRAFVWTIEAARCLAAGTPGYATALRLLRMALDDVEQATRQR
jgi:hypothetical protein